MTVLAQRVTVDDEGATVLTAETDRQAFTVVNRGADPVYLGGEGVTDTDGFSLLLNESVSGELWSGEALYAITGSGLTAILHVLASQRGVG